MCLLDMMDHSWINYICLSAYIWNNHYLYFSAAQIHQRDHCGESQEPERLLEFFLPVEDHDMAHWSREDSISYEE